MTLRSVISKRRAFLKAMMTLVIIVVIATVFTYPGQIWIIFVIAGAVSAAGVFLRIKLLITSGFLAIGISFYLFLFNTYFQDNLNLDISPFDMILLSGFFILLYGCALFVYEFTRRDIILNELKGGKDELLEGYMKKWRSRVFKNLALSFLLAMMASMVSQAASLDLGTLQGRTISFAAAAIFAIFALVLTFFLMVKLPDLYENRD